MLRDIYVFKSSKKIFHIQFGTSIEWDTLEPIIESFAIQFKSYSKNTTGSVNLSNYKFTYFVDIKHALFLLFISDLTNDEADLEKQIEKGYEEFISMFEDLINETTDPAAFASYNPVAEMIHQNLRPKIALIGFPGVGKTTITKLIKAEEIPTEHIPTVTGDIAAIKIGRLYFHLWDFAGQEEYSFLWPSFLQNSDGVLIITNSILQNIDESKFFIDLAKKEVPNARLCVIANKQDLPDVLDPKRIASLLNVKTYGMVAINTDNRAKMIQIIGELLNLSPQISPMIRPLLDRDKALQEAEDLLEKNDFEGAILQLKSIAELSRELGDDKISLELFERIKIIESFLESKTPAETTESEPEVFTEHEKEVESPSQLEVAETTGDLKAPNIKDILTTQVKFKPEEPPSLSELGIPEISKDSKPIHTEKTAIINSEALKPIIEKSVEPIEKPQPIEKSVPTEKEKKIIKIAPPSSEIIKSNLSQSFISRNISYLISKNYLELNPLNFDKHQIVTALSDTSEKSLFDFLRSSKAQINSDELLILPNFSALSESKLVIKSPQKDISQGPSEISIPSENIFEEKIERLIKQEHLSLEEKIKTLKDDLNEIEKQMDNLKQKMDTNQITNNEFKNKIAQLRAYRKIIQDKISDLSIQKIKSFDINI